MQGIWRKICLLLWIVLLAATLSVYGQKEKTGMVLIKGATFEMGIDKADIPKFQQIFNIKRAELFQEATPLHKVKLSSFDLDKYEVTNTDFKKFTDKNPDWQKDKIPAEFHNGKYLQDWNGNDFPKGKENYPVVFVSWYAAVAFCQSLGKRLPTEAEWEYAARGGLKNKIFPWGDEMPDKTRANFGASQIEAATKVGSYPPNGYGLFDMAGNVWEILADEWKLYPTTTELQVNPVVGGDFFLTDSYRQIKSRRALRGGSYGGAPVNLMITYRDSHSPENAGDHVGFRCAQNAKKGE
ncbi:MAG: formylglycine-generating enzyme family protein [Pyrinomonadaceae bacterium]|nr:formylglycine-generating enzyme family protein [Pyrinomonadaceae bacterium]